MVKVGEVQVLAPGWCWELLRSDPPFSHMLEVGGATEASASRHFLPQTYKLKA